MLFPMSCKYSNIWLCHPSLFRKTELLLRNHFEPTSPSSVPVITALFAGQQLFGGVEAVPLLVDLDRHEKMRASESVC